LAPLGQQPTALVAYTGYAHSSRYRSDLSNFFNSTVFVEHSAAVAPSLAQTPLNRPSARSARRTLLVSQSYAWSAI